VVATARRAKIDPRRRQAGVVPKPAPRAGRGRKAVRPDRLLLPHQHCDHAVPPLRELRDYPARGWCGCLPRSHQGQHQPRGHHEPMLPPPALLRLSWHVRELQHALEPRARRAHREITVTDLPESCTSSASSARARSRRHRARRRGLGSLEEIERASILKGSRLHSLEQAEAAASFCWGLCRPTL